MNRTQRYGRPPERDWLAIIYVTILFAVFIVVIATLMWG